MDSGGTKTRDFLSVKGELPATCVLLVVESYLSFGNNLTLSIREVWYRKNLNNWTVCYVVGLSSLSMVKKKKILSQKGERGCVFAVFFAPFPEKGILDYIAHRPIIQVFTVQ